MSSGKPVSEQLQGVKERVKVKVAKMKEEMLSKQYKALAMVFMGMSQLQQVEEKLKILQKKVLAMKERSGQT